MIKVTRNAIRVNDWAYADHVAAETYQGTIRSLQYFQKTFGESPEKVVELMFSHLRAMHRMKRKDAIRTVLGANK